MKRTLWFRPAPLLVAIVIAILGQLAAANADDRPKGAIWVLEITDAIGPATSDYIVRGIHKAQDADAGLIVIEIDTPGGLSTSMREIISTILDSKVPVASYVTPRGARAASAGTYIMYASHFAAMNEATNIGAATPIQIGMPSMPSSGDKSGSNPGNNSGDSPADSKAKEKAAPTGSTEERKMVNDAAAYIRSLAELRGRNSAWAEEAVREASSLSASEALKSGVIDLIASSLDDLVGKLDGREVKVAGADVRLNIKGHAIHRYHPDWRTDLLSTLTNPNMVLILGMFGVYGILLEFYNPGSVIPGTVGVICLLLAGYALQMLPINYAGLGLIALGIGLMVAEAMAPSFGVMGIGGIISFTIGGIMLFDSDLPAFTVGLPVLAAIALVTAILIIATINIALRMRRRPVTTGVERLVGRTGQALTDVREKGQVRIGGEIWKAAAQTSIPEGAEIRVAAIDGMILIVEPTQEGA